MTITLALSKGRIFEETLPLLRAAGIEVSVLPGEHPDAQAAHAQHVADAHKNICVSREPAGRVIEMMQWHKPFA